MSMNIKFLIKVIAITLAFSIGLTSCAYVGLGEEIETYSQDDIDKITANYQSQIDELERARALSNEASSSEIETLEKTITETKTEYVTVVKEVLKIIDPDGTKYTYNDETGTITDNKTNTTVELSTTIESEKLDTTILQQVQEKLSDYEAKVAEMQTKLNSLELSNSELESIKEELTSEIAELNDAATSKDTLISKLESDIESKSAKISELESSNSSSNLDIESKSIKISELEAEVKAKIEEIQSLNDVITSKNTEISGLKDSLKESEDNVRNLTDELTTKNNEIVKLNAEISTKSTEISNAQSKINDLNSQIAELQSSNSNNESKIESLQSEIATYKSNIENLQSEISADNTQISNLQSEVTSLTSQISDSSSKIAQLQSDINAKNTEISSLKSEVQGLQSTISSQNSEIESLNNTIAEQNEEIERLNAIITARDATIEELKNGNGNSITTLLAKISGYIDDLANATLKVNKLIKSTNNSLIEILAGYNKDYSVYKDSTKEEDLKYLLNEVSDYITVLTNSIAGHTVDSDYHPVSSTGTTIDNVTVVIDSNGVGYCQTRGNSDYKERVKYVFDFETVWANTPTDHRWGEGDNRGLNIHMYVNGSDENPTLSASQPYRELNFVGYVQFMTYSDTILKPTDVQYLREN